MTISYILQPFAIFFDWMRTFEMQFGEVSFTFMDLFVWVLLASIVLGFIRSLME